MICKMISHVLVSIFSVSSPFSRFSLLSAPCAVPYSCKLFSINRYSSWKDAQFCLFVITQMAGLKANFKI